MFPQPADTWCYFYLIAILLSLSQHAKLRMVTAVEVSVVWPCQHSG